MYEDILRQLDATVLHVFETMLGLICLPQPDGLRSGLRGALDVTASVSYSGAVNGECLLRLDLPVAAQFASLFLDVPRPAVQLCLDAAAELCNMVAGTLKHQLAGPREDCVLSVPRVSFVPETHPVRQHALCRAYGVDGHPLSIELYLD